ncbi:MAG: hypothetical protein JNL95_13100 [Chitinophagales bacterium]|nr:hypothetical protein [Chitinophagales bacterium]
MVELILLLAVIFGFTEAGLRRRKSVFTSGAIGFVVWLLARNISSILLNGLFTILLRYNYIENLLVFSIVSTILSILLSIFITYWAGTLLGFNFNKIFKQ